MRDVGYHTDASAPLVLRPENVGALTASAKEAPVSLPYAPGAYWADQSPRTFLIVIDIESTDSAANTIEVYGGSDADINAPVLLSIAPAGSAGSLIRAVNVPPGFDHIAVRGVVASGARLDYSARLYQQQR